MTSTTSILAQLREAALLENIIASTQETDEENNNDPAFHTLGIISRETMAYDTHDYDCDKENKYLDVAQQDHDDDNDRGHILDDADAALALASDEEARSFMTSHSREGHETSFDHDLVAADTVELGVRSSASSPAAPNDRFSNDEIDEIDDDDDGLQEYDATKIVTKPSFKSNANPNNADTEDEISVVDDASSIHATSSVASSQLFEHPEPSFMSSLTMSTYHFLGLGGGGAAAGGMTPRNPFANSSNSMLPLPTALLLGARVGADGEAAEDVNTSELTTTNIDTSVDDILLGVASSSPPASPDRSFRITGVATPAGGVTIINNSSDPADWLSVQAIKGDTTFMTNRGCGPNQNETSSSPHNPQCKKWYHGPLSSPHNNTEATASPTSSKEYNDEHDQLFQYGKRKNRFIWIASILGCLIIIFVIVLSTVLIRNPAQNISNASSSAANANNGLSPFVPGSINPYNLTTVPPSLRATVAPSNGTFDGGTSIDTEAPGGGGGTYDNGGQEIEFEITRPPGDDNATELPAFIDLPSLAPLSDFALWIQDVIESELPYTPTDIQKAALNWMIMTADQYEQALNTRTKDPSKVLQRFQLVVLDLSLQQPQQSTTQRPSNRQLETSSLTPMMAEAALDECDWPGVVCNASTATPQGGGGRNIQVRVIKLVWANRGWAGQLPNQGWKFLSDLQYFDLGENQIHGSIPESFYLLTNLRYLYLHENQFTGTLSNSLSQLTNLTNFYAGNNQLSGPLPAGLGSAQFGAMGARPLRSLSLHSNQLTGTLPNNLNWRNMWYLDLSENQLNGTFPLDWVNGTNKMLRIRHLLLNNNQFTGSLPSNLGSIGNGRLEMLVVADNQFTGTVPGTFPTRSYIQQLELQNNQFSALTNDLCYMAVWFGGEMVNFRADCGICNCPFNCGKQECY